MKVLAALALVAVAAAVLLLLPPRFYPFCPLHEWTGLACPLCGMTRAFAALLRGHVGGALHRNALVVSAAAVLAIRAASNRSGGPLVPARVVGPLLAAALVFAVARNLAPALLGP